MAMIRVHDLYYAYPLENGECIIALQNIDLTIEQGEFVAIIGPNGSGKSTLARCLNGLLLPTSGRVEIDGMSTADPRHMWAIRQRLGMVFQNPDNQLVASTVQEDIAFGLENQACPPDVMRRRVDAALALVGLEEYATHPPQMLSGGQKQLVAIAGILAMQSACIVLDEPASMLDPVGRRQLLQALQRLHAERGLSIVLITQSMQEAALAGRVLVMNAGQVVMDGPPGQVFEHEEPLQTLHLGLPPIAQIAGRLRESGIKLAPGLLTVDALVEALC